jgi:hypothetical protein
VASVTVTVERAGGGTERVPATLSGGVWTAPVTLGAGDVAYVDAGGVRDANGETNGTRSASVTG